MLHLRKTRLFSRDSEKTQLLPNGSAFSESSCLAPVSPCTAFGRKDQEAGRGGEGVTSGRATGRAVHRFFLGWAVSLFVTLRATERAAFVLRLPVFWVEL